MPRMRVTTRLLTNAAVFAVALLSNGLALAAEPPVAGQPRPRAQVGPEPRPDRARAQRPPAAGRVVPVVGRPDYGTVENGFGAARSGHVHAGQDVFASAGTPVVAVADGVVAERGSDAGQGNYAYLYDPDRKQTYVYMHLIEPAEVGAGERVRAGEWIGGVGCTGSCWGDHLHFEIRAGRGIVGEARDPLPALTGWRSLERPR
jgi:murein DD-endopeptidase MepM/ murein hydrolase activator NlpD